MINELEKQFFQCFGIEPNLECIKPSDERCNECGCCELKYPQITDRILLELICIVAKYYCFHWNNWIDEYSSVDKLKNFILLELIGLVHQQGIKHQVRTLFEEGK